MTYCLTTAEVIEVTGAKRAKGQLRWLHERGIPAELGDDRKVKVLRAAVEKRMMPKAPAASSITRPNLEALNRASTQT